MSSAAALPGSLSRPSVCLRCARTVARRQDLSIAAPAQSWRGRWPTVPPPQRGQQASLQRQHRLYRTVGKAQSIATNAAASGRDDEAASAAVSDRRFFWANAFHGKSRTEVPRRPLATAARIEEEEELPHRRRKRLKEASAISSGGLGREQIGLVEQQHRPQTDESGETPLPFDASTTLAQDAAAAPARSFRRIFSTYLALTKPRLAFLIVLTTTASYSIYPVPALLSTSVTSAPSLSTLTLLFLTTGTFLAISSANTLNMLFEPQHDAKMSRTKNRPLVRGLVTPRAARLFAVATGVAGTLLLWYGVHPTTALLGAANIMLYAYAYTPLKRLHPVNTWVGAVVGAIPPLMGWCAAGSQYITSQPSPPGSPAWSAIWEESVELLAGPEAVGGWLLAALLFAWQFPHFFALSHAVRAEYAGAGYRMLTSTNIPMAARVSLRYSLAMFPICAGLCWANVADPPFAVLSAGINAWMAREAWHFWRKNGEQGSARRLFWASVWQLPIVLVLAMVLKKGLWGRIWTGVFGDEEGEELDDEDEV